MQINEQLIPVINSIATGMGIVIDWTKETALPYVEDLFLKYLTYASFVHIFTMSTALVITILYFILSFKNKAIKEFFNSFMDDGNFIRLLIGVALLIITIAIMIYNIYQLIILGSFPELYIYNHIITKAS